jgi:predicted nuclease with TOPRIM domain
MPLPDMGEGGAVAGIATAITVAVVGAYKALRGLKSDSRTDNIVSDLDARLKEERERADKFARERMEKAEENAGLRSDVKNLTERLSTLEKSVEAKDKRIEALEDEIKKLETTYDILVEEAVTTSALLMQAGHGDILDKVRSLHAHREQALDTLRNSPCAAARISSPPDKTVVERNKRIAGNKAPLRSLPDKEDWQFDTKKGE